MYKQYALTFRKLACTIDVGWAKGQNTREGKSDRNSPKVTPVGCIACSDVVEWLANQLAVVLMETEPFLLMKSSLGWVEASGFVGWLLKDSGWRPGFKC